MVQVAAADLADALQFDRVPESVHSGSARHRIRARSAALSARREQDRVCDVKSALIWPARYNSIVFLVLLLALNAGEEVALGLFRHRNVSETIAHLGGGTLHQLIATSIIIFLILIPFFAFRAKQG